MTGYLLDTNVISEVRKPKPTRSRPGMDGIASWPSGSVLFPVSRFLNYRQALNSPAARTPPKRRKSNDGLMRSAVSTIFFPSIGNVSVSAPS